MILLDSENPGFATELNETKFKFFHDYEDEKYKADDQGHANEELEGAKGNRNEKPKENITESQPFPDDDSEEGDFDRVSEYLRTHSHECKNTTRPKRTNPLVYDTWHHHRTDKHNIYMYSAFFDERRDNGFYPSVRILAVAATIPDENPIFCQVWYPGVTNPVVKKVKVKKNGGGHKVSGVWLEQYYFVCHLEMSYPIPRRVSVVSQPCATALNSVPIYLPIRAPYQHEFGVCVPVAFWRIPPYRLVEWIEANRMFGVSEINVYHVNMSAETLGILRYFETNDTIVRLHSIPSVPKYERTRGGNKIGSPISLNDCMYRNTYRYRWTVVIDFDEIIVPRMHDNYSAMVDHILAKAKLTKIPPPALTFRNAYFWTGCGSQQKSPDGSVMLRHLVREPPNKFLYAAKSFIDPTRCTSVFNHYCLHKFPMRYPNENWTVDVGDKVALSHHYRENYKNMKCEKFKEKAVNDKTLLKYKSILSTRAEKQLHRLGF